MKKTLLGLFIVSVLALATTAWAPDSEARQGSRLILRPTGDNSGCAATPATPVCKEVCILTAQGQEVPLGLFCCTPAAGSSFSNLQACLGNLRS